jgi:hypothetical protein
MKRTLATFVLISTLAGSRARATAAPAAAATDDPLQLWNQTALASLRERRASDAEVARLLAMLNVAMYDAINGIESRTGHDDREHALVPPAGAPPRGDLREAASAAAAAVLQAVYPGLTTPARAQLEERVVHRCGARATNAAGNDGRAWGAQVGAQVVNLRSNDGSSPTETQALSGASGQFAGVWSGVQYRNLQPFAIANPADYVTAGPPAIGTLDYAAALAEVKLLGNVSIKDADKSEIYQYWSLSSGTAQPPGEWLKIALEVAAARGLGLADEARLLALVSMALVDTVAPTVTTKFTYGHWRPTPAIRQAANDENPYTDNDQAWAARAGSTGSSPEHTSGHSAFSAAAATTLAGFFCDDGIAFSHVSDSSPGGKPRSFPGFSAAAAEAGRSRVLGGVHFEFSNQAGLAAGKGVAAEVLAKKLLLRRGKTHFGRCPL